VNSEMNQTDVYRKAIQRTFAKLYSVPAEAIDVVCARGAITASEFTSRGALPSPPELRDGFRRVCVRKKDG
jgi:hypothetical protein